MAPRKGTAPWNAGTGRGWINARGYREIRVNGRVVKEHRWLMELHLGRALFPYEDVHHLNGDKSDNRPENLQVVAHGDHSRVTNSERVYVRGKRHKLSPEERARRSEHMKRLHCEGRAMPPQARAALAKATGAA